MPSDREPARRAKGVSADALFDAMLDMALEARELHGIHPAPSSSSAAAYASLPPTAYPSPSQNHGGGQDAKAESSGSAFDPLNFSACLRERSPCVFEGIPATYFPRAWSRWRSTAYLSEAMSDGLDSSPHQESGGGDRKESKRRTSKKIRVALTPTGRADDLELIEEAGKAKTVFALPHEESMCVPSLPPLFVLAIVLMRTVSLLIGHLMTSWTICTGQQKSGRSPTYNLKIPISPTWRLRRCLTARAVQT